MTLGFISNNTTDHSQNLGYNHEKIEQEENKIVFFLLDFQASPARSIIYEANAVSIQTTFS